MLLPRFSAWVRTALSVIGAVALLALPDSPRTTAAAAQRQAGLGAAVPRDPQARSVLRRSPARARALIEARQRRLDYVPGEVIVKFRDGMTSVRRQRALTALRSRPSVSDLEWHRNVALLYDPTEPDARVLARQLNAQPEVEYAEPNYLVRIRPVSNAVPLDVNEAHPAATPNDPAYSAQWNLSALDMPRAWDINPGASSDVIVAVVDTGVTTVNQSFNFPYWDGSSIRTISMPFAISPGLPASRHTRSRDFAFWDGAVLDVDGHGTHVASTIAEATNDMSRAAGIAYNVVVMPVKVCTGFWDEQIIRSSLNIPGRADEDDPGCTFMDVAQGVEYAAEQGAKVINLSLGAEFASTRLRDALDFAVRRGAFIAIAMGNLFEDLNPTVYPAKYAELFQGAMSVAAVGRSLATRASYSSTGSHCEIAAPGGDLGDFIFQTTLAEPGHNSVSPNFTLFGVFGSQGTSMATPHVAGLAALIISQRPGITPAQVEAIIRATAKDIGAPGKDNDFGYGLIQPRAALFGLGIRK
ncbi:MAG TPA: S8 family serine peptidase [Vicinamibacterales bacterium]|nr:S8 family serine peptidase [Vicinamibacterales bacterium]